jgi:hypothetical protein
MRVIQERMDRVNDWTAVLALWLLPVSVAYGTLGSVAAWVVFVAGLLGIVARIVVVLRRRRPPSAVEVWAAEHGWDYDRRSSAVPLSGRDVLWRELDGVVVTSYTTTAAPDMSAETAMAPRHAVCAIVPADLPTLRVLPESLARRPGAAPLEPDIQFESAAFNSRWRVHCADATFAHAFCHPRVMERLMRPDARGVSLLVEGRDVVVHAPGPTDLDVVESRAGLAADLARLVPPYLIARYPLPTNRRRRRASEHSRSATVLGTVLLAGWIAFLVPIGTAGEPGMAIVLGATPVALMALVILAGADPHRRRERAERRARSGTEPPPGP